MTKRKLMQNNLMQLMVRWPRWLLVVGLLCHPANHARAVILDPCDGAPDCCDGSPDCFVLPEDDNDQDDADDNCDPPTANDGPTGGDSPCGMPVWRVSEPFINLWLHDTPLRYRLASGQWLELKLSYKHRDEWEDRRQNLGGFGNKWECNWLGALEMNSEPYVTNYLAGGGQGVFKVDGSVPEYRSGRRMGSISHNAGGPSSISSSGNLAINSRTGSQNGYGSLWTNPQGRQYALLSQRLDRYGRTTRYEWETNGTGSAQVARLKTMTDRDGRTCSLAYTNTSFPRLITSVTDPYGRSARFLYDTNGMLTTIIDMAGMSAGINYTQTNIASSLVTLYGTNSFKYFDSTNVPTGGLTNRAIEVTEADGSLQLYAYRSLTNGGTIGGTFACTDGQTYARNSYHWNRAQYAAISATGKANYLDLPAEDYWKASLQHWLLQNFADKVIITDTPSATAGPVLQPDVDDTRCAQVFYEYQGQTSALLVGTQKRVAKVVWNGTAYSQGVSTELDIARNDWGRPTNITHYYNGNTVSYANTYDADGRTLQSVLGPRGEPVRGYGYPTNLHRLLTSVTNALGEVTRYTHNTNGLKVTSITYPGGLVTTNLYYTSGTYTGFLAQTVDQGFRTNSFGYLNGNVASQTNELGLVTANTWDGLDRLAAVKFPDGSYTSNLWDKLDLTGTRDRLGY